MSSHEPRSSSSTPRSGLALASPLRDAKIMVAYQDYRGRFYFLRPEIDASQTMSLAMDQVRAAMGTNLTKMIFGISRFVSAFCVPVVETATVSAVCLNEIEADHFPREVFLSGREVSPELTALFNGYTVAFGTTVPFAAKYPDMITGSMTASNGNVNKVIAVSYKLKQGTVLWLVISGLIVSVLVSLVLGLKMRNIQVAFAAFGAMTLVMTVPLNVIFRMTE
ncbi:hypothetical protein EDB80DRAFT_888261 [Ilyonectria destructans]|nr:hypothetical protein EDB80DRAFT_888261 [Ilyonectria destructans]